MPLAVAGQSSLIKIFQFSERPGIVSPEVLGPDVVERALSPKMKFYLLHTKIFRIKRFLFFHYRPSYFQHFCCQFYSHFGFNAALTLPIAEHSGKVADEVSVAS